MNERILVQQDDPRCETATTLMRDLLAEETIRYSEMGPDAFDSFRPEDALAPRGVFVIARLDAQPVGCGALREIDVDSAEINRMYVAPTMRRLGVGRTILAELERHAAEFCYRVIRLETGNRQPEAISLYEGSGFHRIPAFGAHAADPVSVFFEKEVERGGQQSALRSATESDIPILCASDQIASQSHERREFIRHSVTSGTCFVAESVSKRIAGYSVLTYSFFRYGLVEMLYVSPEFRRQGFGAALLQHMEKHCHTHKIFASTNLSNVPMQSLLTSEHFVQSGTIHNLDDGDPEIVYFKQLRT